MSSRPRPEVVAEEFPAWQRALFERRTLGVRLGLDALTRVDEALGRPLSGCRVAQVVGTNGKGSVATMLSTLLEHAGLGPVGLYTSPHLHRVGERVRVNGAALDDDALHRFVQEVEAAEAGCGVRLSFFEVLTAVALLAFEASGVRVAVLEAGLGGRLDATRIRPAEVIGVARVDLDHQEFLGDTLEAIASEKAAVIHPDAEVFSVTQVDAARRVISLAAERHGVTPTWVHPAPRVPEGLVGSHQAINAGLALAMARAFPGAEAAELPWLDGVRLPGRLEQIARENAWAVFDVAHNPGGLRALRDALRARGRPARLVVGWRGGRPAREMLDACPEAGELAWVSLDGGGPPPDGAPWTRVFERPDDPAIAPWMAEIEGYSVVCGSHRLVGPVRAAWLHGAKSDPWALTDPT